MTSPKRNQKQRILLALGIVFSVANSILFPYLSSYIAMSTVIEGFVEGMYGFTIGVVIAPFILLIGIKISFSLTSPFAKKEKSYGYYLKYLYFFIIPIMFIIGTAIFTHDPRTNLMQASSKGDINKVRKILSKGRDNINKVTAYGGRETHALKEAIENNNFEIVKLLIGSGADINIQPHVPVILASQLGNYEIVEFLINNGAILSVEEHYKSTALNEAAGNGYFKIVKLLVEHDAIKNSTDMGAYAVVKACWNDHKNIAIFLIEKGADNSAIKEHGCRTTEENIKELIKN